ncbi:MAG: vanadium-dependent haloperoxidase [Actinomycetota bacterium]|nr:vanadium-dependent haloperoxidase [Actinomycetota bacterium]
MSERQIWARRIRETAAEVAFLRPTPQHRANGDEQRLHDEQGRVTYAGNFTKCLPHDEYGFLQRPTDYADWVRSIDSGDPSDFLRLRLGPGPFEPNGDLVYEPDGKPQLNWAGTYPAGEEPTVRAWESQGAGSTFDLEGSDAQALTMPPAPALASQELISEMGEDYWMALSRDIPFTDWGSDATVHDARESLARLWWFRRDRTDRLTGSTDVLPTSRNRRRVLSQTGTDVVPLEQLFRGLLPGELLGPYISQFLLIGNVGINGNDTAHELRDGMIAYGALRIDQRVRVASPGVDYLTDWDAFLDVQNGADTRGRESYADGYRFIATPRDLATYVHYDALYEAYLNACLVLLGLRAPFDPGLPFERPDFVDKQQGFAQFGGPHILTLVTEVATRALKAVRYQKFNVHRRLRPEAVGGWMYQRRVNNAIVQERLRDLEAMEAAFAGSSGIGAAVGAANGNPDNWLLPMAFPEGSPTHPSYGAGHATVAGACTTILKAWFDHGWPLTAAGNPIAYEANPDGSALVDVSAALDRPLTVEGELNKIAANISTARNFAGVHYYSDFIESFRLGEQIALTVLEEQKLTYRENFSLTVPLSDGTTVRI